MEDSREIAGGPKSYGVSSIGRLPTDEHLLRKTKTKRERAKDRERERERERQKEREREDHLL